MLLGKYLEKQQIECTQCGLCCPPECPHLRGKLCAIHPNQSEIDPNHAVCELSPTELIPLRVRCPPVLEIIFQITGIRVSQSSTDPRFCNKEELAAALITDISL